MILPPALAYIPDQEMTYGQVRKLIAEDNRKGMALGCSSSQIARHLETDGHENVCADGSIYCWNRCMNHTEYVDGISPEVCQERNLELKCVNPRGQVYSEGHGDFYPDCTDSTEVNNYCLHQKLSSHSNLFCMQSLLHHFQLYQVIQEMKAFAQRKIG